jgi:hypothetical protein
VDDARRMNAQQNVVLAANRGLVDLFELQHIG